MEKLKKNIKSLFQFVIIITALYFSYIKTIKNNKNNNNLIKKGYQTTGIIIDQYSTGYSNTHRVKFSYMVNNIKYTKSVIEGLKFIGCDVSRKCIGRKFVVYFDIDNPKNVYIDFDDEIGGGVR